MAKRYSEVEIEKALIAAATLGIRPAARELNIPETNIRRWVAEQPERYAEVRETEAPKWRARAAAQFEDVVDTLSELEQAAADKLSLDLHALEPKDVAGTLKNISVAKGINAQHVNSLRDRPTEVHEHRYSLELVQKAIAEIETVDSTAEVIGAKDATPLALAQNPNATVRLSPEQSKGAREIEGTEDLPPAA